MVDDAGRWNRVKQVFQEALERRTDERGLFLRAACGDDRELQREVESLLVAHVAAGSFAQGPAIEALAPSAAVSLRDGAWAEHRLQWGARLGHYEILAAIGKGGMGEVWKARDTTLHREVAIKMLPEAFAQDADRVARLEREATLLASLNHPNIATIHGLDADQGTRFLVLQLVEGRTLADRLRRGAIPVEESLKLAVQIADALEAAHEKGVVHRDLKPASAIALAVLGGVAGWFLANRSASTTPASVVRLSIPVLEPPFFSPFGSPHLSISPDGSRVAYASASRLWIRRLGQKEAVAIDVASSSNPFFSPNGDWVGFFDSAGGGLRKVPALGGAPVQIVATSDRPAGGTWRADGTIVFATSEGLYQVSENGGEPRLLVKPDPRRRERDYLWPQVMPDGRSVLFTIVPKDSIEGAQIAMLDLKTLETKVVVTGGSSARYASTGYLVYAAGQTLKAVAFDPEAQRTRGAPVSLPDIEVATTPDNGAAEFAVSETGTLLFIAPNVPDQGRRTLAWLDRRGKEEALALAPGRYGYARISPDGTRVALDIAGANRDIWIWNLQRPGLTRLTSGPTEDILPVWSRDGRRVYFASDRTGNFDVYSQAADGATMDRVEFAGPGSQFPQSFTPDGTRLLVIENFKDLDLLNLRRTDRLEPLLHSEFSHWLGEVSPDGQWMAYESNESGNQFEIFLRPFPNVSARRERVSIDGGRYPLWGPKDSGELFYVDLKGGMMSASVKLTPSLSIGRVTKLFDWERPARGASGRRYDNSPIDGRFLMTKSVKEDSNGQTNISVVLNWFEELRERAALRAR